MCIRDSFEAGQGNVTQDPRARQRRPRDGDSATKQRERVRSLPPQRVVLVDMSREPHVIVTGSFWLELQGGDERGEEVCLDPRIHHSIKNQDQACL
eukprot:1925720-Pyramimonas_sp.AAC.1